LRNGSEARRRLACDHHYFDRIDTEQKAYWLGFIAADGCVTRSNGSPTLSVALSMKDLGHLERLRAALSSEHRMVRSPGRPITYRAGRTYMAAASVSLSIASPDLCAALVTQGVTERKSLTLRWPDALPTALLRHYLRGYIDGDGCWHVGSGERRRHWYLALCSSWAFLEPCRAYLSPVAGHGSVDDVGTYAQLRYGGRVKVLTLWHHLYDGASVWLERKRAVVADADAAWTDRRTRGPDGRYRTFGG
jgi:hypothetical protein